MNMTNYTFLIGRIAQEPKLEETENGNKYMNMTIAVPRTFKNAEGQYDTDFVDCVLWRGIAENVSEYCQKGDLVGIKGRIESKLYDTKDGETKKSQRIIAEKVSFLASHRSKQQEQENKDEKTNTKGNDKKTKKESSKERN